MCMSMARTCERVASTGPATSTWLKSPSMTPKGISSTIECESMNRRIAEWHTTSGLARGAISGSTSSIASDCEEVPSRTCMAIMSPISRSHRRVPSWAISTSASGEGRCQPM